MLGLVLLIGFGRDDRHRPTLPCILMIGIATLVADGCARLDVVPDIQKDGKMGCIPFLPTSQVKGKRMAIKVCFQMNFGLARFAKSSIQDSVI